MDNVTDRVTMMLEEGTVDKSTMIYLNKSKKSFRCEVCGANVFTKTGKFHYKCNGCNASYSGES